MIEKQCSTCHVVKSIFAFRVNTRRKDGFEGQCRTCIRERVSVISKRWYEANKERNRARTRGWAESNRERMTELQREWRKANPEAAREHERRYAEANPEKRAEKNRNYRLNNPERFQAYTAIRKQRVLHAMSPLDIKKSVAYRKRIKDNPCLYCGGPGEVVDHFYPLALGGTDHWWNLVRACTECNNSKKIKLGSVFLHMSVSAKETNLKESR